MWRTRMWPLTALCLVAVNAAVTTPSVQAQQVTTQTPLQNNSSSFFEQSNVSWGIRNPHYFFSFNGGGATPPFGGYQPNAGVHGGFSIGNAQFNYGFAQGASTSSSTFAPMLTTTSGYPGSLFIGTVRPFVVGAVPVVGAGGFANVAPAGPLAQRIATGELQIDGGKLATINSIPKTAPTTPVPLDLSQRLAERRAAIPQSASAVTTNGTPSNSLKGAGATDDSAEGYLARGLTAERDGKPGLARVYYQLAATKGEGLVHLEAEAKLAALRTKTGSPSDR